MYTPYHRTRKMDVDAAQLRRCVEGIRDGVSLAALCQRFPARVVEAARKQVTPQPAGKRLPAGGP